MPHTTAPSGVEWFADDAPRDTTLDTSELVSTPTRRIQIGDDVATSADIDIEVTLTPHGETVFRAGVWNLTDRTWSEISIGDPVELTLGWADGGERTICEGRITHRASYTRQGDMFYLLHGDDSGSRALSERWANSWHDVPLGTIVHDIVDHVDGVSDGFIQTGVLGTGSGESVEVRREPVTLDGFTTIRRSKRLAAWLDVLAGRAGRESGVEYEWYVENGQLSFHPKQVLPDERVVLSTEGSVTRLSSVSGVSSQSGDVREFQFASLCQPELRKRARVALDMASGMRECRVVSYTFRSGVTAGEHHCLGTLVGKNASYRVE